MADEITKSAILSDCGTYRYELRRTWDERPPVGWIMLNPSTADASEDDPTIRRCMAYARTWGHGGIVVRNLYALRSTDPRALKTHPNPVGPENARYLLRCAGDPYTVCAWGNNADPFDVAWYIDMYVAPMADLRYLALTKAGQPAHPLYLKGDLLPQKFTRRAA
jgi:hypothetical protein